MLADPDLVGQIYEAGAIPEFWPIVLARLATLIDAHAGALLAFGADMQPRSVTTMSYETAFADFLANGAGIENVRPRRALALHVAGFATDLEVCTPEELAADPIYERFLRPYGFGWTSGTVIPVPNRDLLVFDIARNATAEPFRRQEMQRLDLYRPHLARAALLAHRLRLEAAASATAALAAVGLPAACLTAEGRVVHANDLLAGMADRIPIGAFDTLSFKDRGADALLRSALAAAPGEAASRSIPISATAEGPALVAHLVPVVRNAADVFARTAAILVVTPVSLPGEPLTEVLAGLFDLTPAEARIARGIASGSSLDDLTARLRIGRETARSHLKSVMAKTGTSRQAELALLLSGTMLAKTSA